jgi:hypothetical protein
MRVAASGHPHSELRQLIDAAYGGPKNKLLFNLAIPVKRNGNGAENNDVH